MTITLTALPALSDNYIWVLSDADRKTAVIVDPGEAALVIDWLETHQLNCAAILITHHHHDHIDGIGPLVKKYHCAVYAPAQNQIAGTTHPVSGGEQITIAALDLNFQVIAVPGHTLGHVVYYNAPYLFCGDTLFSAGCGRLFEGTPAQMQQSLDQLAALPDDTLVCCTHEYTLNNLAFAQAVEPNNVAIQQHREFVQHLRDQNKPSLPSTIGLEKSINPFLRTYAPAVIQAASTYSGQTQTAGTPTLQAIRAWKDVYKSCDH